MRVLRTTDMYAPSIESSLKQTILSIEHDITSATTLVAFGTCPESHITCHLGILICCTLLDHQYIEYSTAGGTEYTRKSLYFGTGATRLSQMARSMS
ncbi:hypothetical protein BDU57DRAFT_258467 [Ampelomyces quisqualis]|uniref:Uncharacterized protein n=1 Tax=Ampelomyces quisqualis TaxID=50730 RepID=A0A6A5QN36_AMPQU|nr:hypothetical protein BDU57DRAFT_258467 [Ampelomyces quisqualis]